MAKLQCRTFPDDIYEKLVNDAKQQERSVEGHVRFLLTDYFLPVFEYEIETRRLEDGSFTCTTTSKTGSVELLLKNQYSINDDGNEDTFALARDVSDQLSIIVNAFEKDNAQEIIVAAAGEIQSLVQKDCIDRSH